MTKKRRYLKPWIQMILEVNVLLILGFFCSLVGFELKLSVILVFALLLSIMAVSAYLLSRYGRYEDEL